MTNYGSKIGQNIKEPLETITTRDRFGLVTIKGIDYRIVDIGLRMLELHELYGCQGFPADYIIDHDYSGKSYPRTEQVNRCGNAVCPPIPAALVRANLPEMCIRQRMPNMQIKEERLDSSNSHKTQEIILYTGGMKMLNKTIWVIIIIVMLFGNRKTRVAQILAAQLRVFRNAKTRKTSIWDSICFIVMPVIVAIIISFDLGWEINSDTFTGILALILVLIATALEFMFLARRTETESDNKVKKQVMNETLVSFLTSNVLSLFTAILSIVVLEVYDSIAKKILTACIYSAVLMIAMLILMILKRIFALFIDNDKTI